MNGKINMNRADAIDLDEKNKQLESELFHAKEALKHMRSTSASVAKGQFLIDAMRTAYQSNETKVVSEAS